MLGSNFEALIFGHGKATIISMAICVGSNNVWRPSPLCLMKFEMVNESCHEKSRVTAAAAQASISDHLSSLIHNNNDAVFLSAAEGAGEKRPRPPF